MYTTAAGIGAGTVFWVAKSILQWDWIAILISVAASVALLRFQAGTIRLIIACALAGLVVSYLR